jgi:hypothetical protein
VRVTRASPVGGGYIDILAVDRKGDYVVIALIKKSHADARREFLPRPSAKTWCSPARRFSGRFSVSLFSSSSGYIVLVLVEAMTPAGHQAALGPAAAQLENTQFMKSSARAADPLEHVVLDPKKQVGVLQHHGSSGPVNRRSRS